MITMAAQAHEARERVLSEQETGLKIRGHSVRSRRYVVAVAVTLGGVLPVGVLAAAPGLAAGPAYLVSRIPVGVQPVQVAADPATGMIYVGGDGKLLAINAATGAVAATINLAAVAEGIAVDPATDTIYVAAKPQVSRQGSVDVIDGATNAVTSTITEPAGDYAAGVAVDEATDTIYVANSVGSDVEVIDGATNSITTGISTGQGTRPVAVAVDPASDTAWVAGLGGQLWAINGASNSIVQTTALASDPDALAVNASTDTVYIASPQQGTVSVIDGATGTVTATISSLPAVYGLTVDPSSGLVYAAALRTGLGTTSVIDESTNSVLDTIPRGGISVAADSATGKVYVACGFNPGDVWVLAPSTSATMSPVITSSDNTDFYTGQANSFSVQASAIPSATYGEDGPLPAGVTLTPDGSLAGTPAPGTGGQYAFTITAGNGVAPSYPQRFCLTVYQAPAITSASHARFVAGRDNAFALQATGYPVPVFNEAGKLPAWISLIPTSGGWALAGVPAPTSGGVYPIILTATGAGPSASQDFTLTVDTAPAFTSASRATFKPGPRNSFTIRTTGYPAAKLSEHGKLPKGVSFKAAANGTAVLSGHPPRADKGKKFKITLQASNNVGNTARQTFTLKIR